MSIDLEAEDLFNFVQALRCWGRQATMPSVKANETLLRLRRQLQTKYPGAWEEISHHEPLSWMFSDPIDAPKPRSEALEQLLLATYKAGMTAAAEIAMHCEDDDPIKNAILCARDNKKSL